MTGFKWVFCGLAFGVGVACGEVEPASRLMLLVSVDTLRADHLGNDAREEGEASATPTLDALAADSQVFASAYAPSSFTLPSVSSMLTGLHPELLGIRHNEAIVPSATATLAVLLREHGYRTGAVVSNFVLRRAAGLDRGFEIYDDTFPEREQNRPVPERVARDTTDAALDVLDRLTSGAAPIFLWVHYQDPHGPYTPPPGFRERFLARERAAEGGARVLERAKDFRGIGGIPDYQVIGDARDVGFYRAGYRGEIAYLDGEVGRLLAGVRTRGLFDHATIAFAADHGESLGEEDLWFAHGERLSESLIRVPLWFRIPGRAGSLRTDVASLLDLAPTLLVRAGVPPERLPPGRDLLAEAGEDASSRVFLALLEHATVPRMGLIADDWKLLLRFQDRRWSTQLFRLGTDGPDLATPVPEVAQRMREELGRWAKQAEGAARAARQNLSAEDREKLRALGYAP